MLIIVQKLLTIVTDGFLKNLRQAYFLGIFKKLKAQKLNLYKNSRPFFAEKLNMSGFFEASYKKLNANDFNKYTFPKADGIN